MNMHPLKKLEKSSHSQNLSEQPEKNIEMPVILINSFLYFCVKV